MTLLRWLGLEASCLEDWDAMTSFLLNDDLTADHHLAIAFVAEESSGCEFHGDVTVHMELGDMPWFTYIYLYYGL